MSRKDEVPVKLPSMNPIPGYVPASPRNSLTSSRRNSTFKRVSISHNSDQVQQHSVTFAQKTESDILKDAVPLSHVPRFSCDLSIEGRYAVFKGYEKILIKHLEDSYPEYQNLINKTSNAVLNSVNDVTLNREIVRTKTSQYDKEFQSVSNVNEKKKKPTGKTQFSDTTDSISNNNEDHDLQNKAKLLMSQYLQFAHVIIDSLKASNVVKSSRYVGKLPQKNFNPIQGWSWWNGAWQECFIQKYQPSKLNG